MSVPRTWRRFTSRGWAPSTLSAYGSAYQDIVSIVMYWANIGVAGGLGEVSAFLINGSKHSPNSIKKLSAVLSLLFGCCDKSSPAVGPLVTKVKVGVLKNVAIAKRAPWPLWMPENLLTFVTALAKPERSVLDWRIMALQLLCYFTMQRFNDLQGVKVEDIRVLANGDLRIFQKVGKTFQMGQGNYFYVLNKPFGGFTVKSLMDKYVLKLGLKSTDFLFPHFAKSSTGVMTVCRVPIGYGNAHDKLSHVLSSLSLPQVSLHSTSCLCCHSQCRGWVGAGHPQGWGWLEG